MRNKKKRYTTVEDICSVAEKQYQRMFERVQKGLIDRDEIFAAMGRINAAHCMALREGKRELLI